MKENRVFDCPIDMDRHSFDEAPVTLPTIKCNHDPTVCKDCLGLMVESQINGGGWDRIQCPIEGCGEIMAAKDVRTWASPGAFRK